MPLARVVTLVVALLAGTMSPAFADDRVYVDFYANGVQRDSTLVVLRGDDVLAPVADLRAAGVPVAATQAQTLYGAPYASLDALKSELTYRLDTKNLRLDITLAASALKNSAVNLSPSAPSALSRVSTPALVLNYDLHDETGSTWTGSVEQRYSLEGGAVFDDTVGRSFDGAWTRGLTDLTFDDAASMRRTSIGDAVAGGADLGGSAIVGGISVKREFDTNPYAVTFPLPSTEATVLQPSEADIVVNGAVVKTIDLPPGTYDLENLPIHSGIAHAQVVLRNAFGAQTLYDSTLYGSAGLLRKGLTDYDYAVGFDRIDPEETGDTYGAATALANYRIGLSNWTTAGARVESTAGLWSAGVDYDGVVRYGDLHVALAQSDDEGVHGSAAAIGYGSASAASSYSMLLRLQSPAYANLSQPIRDDRPLVEVESTAARRLLAAATVQFSLEYAHYRDSGVFSQLSTALMERVGPANLSLGYSASRSSSSGTALQSAVSLLLSMAVGNTTVATTGVEAGSSPAVTASIEHTPSSPLQTGYGLTLGGAGGIPVSGSAQVGLPFATIGVREYGDIHGGGLSGGLDLAGAVERIDGGTYFSQPVPDALALVEAPGAGDASIFLNNRYVGHTDRAGYAVVPFLAAYQANRVSVADTGFSLDRTLTGEDQLVAPTYHGAGIVRYGSVVERGFVGRIVRPDGTPYAYGELDLRPAGAQPVSSPTDEAGRFYFDNLTPGTYEGTVTDSSGTCRLKIDVPRFASMQYSAGTVSCGP